MGSSIQIPYGSSPPLRVRPLSPHSVSLTHTEGVLAWVTRENPEDLGVRAPEGG